MNFIKNNLKKNHQLYEYLLFLKNKYNKYYIRKSEYKDFRIAYKEYFPINQLENKTQKRNVLILCNHSNFYSIKIELIFSLILKLDNSNIYFLSEKKNYWINKYIKWTKIGKIIFIQDFKIEKFNHTYNNIRNDISIDQIKNMVYKNAWIGPQILSSLFRSFKTGVINLKDDKIFLTLKKIIKNSITYVEIAESISKKNKFDLCIVNEPNYEINGAIVDILISKNIDVIQYIQPSKDDALILKRLNKFSRREHPASLSFESFSKIKNKPWTNQQEIILNNEFISRYNGSNILQKRNQSVDFEENIDILSKIGIKTKKNKFACIFCPVLWDANLFYGEDLFDDFGDWLKETLLQASLNKNIIWLLKLHPANIWKMNNEGSNGVAADHKIINSLFDKIPENIFILEPNCGISTLNLFKVIDYGITVRGTIGIELPCFGIPVITAGTGRYSNLGFTIDSKDRLEYINKLSNLENIVPLTAEQIQLAKWHAYGAFILRPWYMKSFKTIFKPNLKPSSEYYMDFVPNQLSSTDFMNNSDIKQLRTWFSSIDTDFLIQ